MMPPHAADPSVAQRRFGLSDNEATDCHQLVPMATAAQSALGVTTLEVLADSGYSTGDQLVACAAAGITPVNGLGMRLSLRATRGVSLLRWIDPSYVGDLTRAAGKVHPNDTRRSELHGPGMDIAQR